MGQRKVARIMLCTPREQPKPQVTGASNQADVSKTPLAVLMSGKLQKKLFLYCLVMSKTQSCSCFCPRLKLDVSASDGRFTSQCITNLKSGLKNFLV